jgi:DNA repair protein RadC
MKTNNQSQFPIRKTRNGLYYLPKAVSKDQLYCMVLELIEEEYCREELSSTESAKRYLQIQLAKEERELFGVLFLDSQHRVITDEVLFYGTLDSCSVYPREVLKRSLDHNCAATIFYHVHPSGVVEPSKADIQITKQLKDALAFCDIRVLDHFIFAAGNSVSFAERALI